MKISHHYSFYITLRILVVLGQFFTTWLFLKWTFTYFQQNWDAMSKYIYDLINNTKDFEFKVFVDIGTPVFEHFCMFVFVLIILSIFKLILKKFPVTKKTILYWVHLKQIHPLFARRLVQHFEWNKRISHDMFFTFWKEFNYQNSVLNYHQKNTAFYHFMMYFDEDLVKYKNLPSKHSSSQLEKNDVTKEENNA